MATSYRFRFYLSLAIFVAPVLVGANPAGYQPFSRNFKDWSVTCDNGKRCVALGTGESYGISESNMVIRLEQEAGPHGQTTLQLASQKPIELSEMRLDGVPLKLDPAVWKEQTLDESQGNIYRYQLMTRDGHAIATWLAVARDCGELSFGEVSLDSAPKASLKGLSAALLQIDDVQGRIGTTAALLRKGQAPVSAIPDAPRLPIVPAASKSSPALPEGEQRRLINATLAQHGKDIQNADCTDADLDDTPALRQQQNRAVALSGNEALVALACEVSSAYNHTDLWYRVQRKAPYVAKALDWGDRASAGLDPASVASELANGGYDPASGEMNSYEKLRGIGDCGTSTTWVFDGSEFQLAEIRLLGQCVGLPSDEWPWLYRTARQ
jgi:hypothetical protein